MNKQEQVEPVLIKLPIIKKMIGVASRNTVKKLISENNFPEPIKINRVQYWEYEKVLNWAQDRLNKVCR
ncbi:MAG: hypothetical protein WC982_03815 [Advenella sp.]